MKRELIKKPCGLRKKHEMKVVVPHPFVIIVYTIPSNPLEDTVKPQQRETLTPEYGEC